MTGPLPDRVDGDSSAGAADRAFVDLHCHTSASFDSLATPQAVARTAAARGMTHLAITDHDRIDGALEAQAEAPPGLTVIVGEEIRTLDGDLIGLFLQHAVRPGLSARDTIAAIRVQGGLVGIAHPFDRFRGSLLRNPAMAALAGEVDWIETWNARLVGRGNEHAAEFAVEHARPGVAVSDAHTTLEVGVAYTILDGSPDTPAALLSALPGARLVTGRASYVARLVTPVAKVVQRARGRGRVSRAVVLTAGREHDGRGMTG
jgi:predicted metal-dependent phosphoesterase TrpH